MSKFPVQVAVVLVLTVLADLLLYGHQPGLGLSIFALAVAAAVFARYGERLRRAGPWPALWLALALGASLQASVFGRLLLVVLGWASVTLALSGPGMPLFLGVRRGIAAGLWSFTTAAADSYRVLQFRERRSPGGGRPAWVVALPVALVLTFAALIVPANLVLARWCKQLYQAAVELFPNLTVQRVLFWLVVGLGLYGLLRFRRGLLRRRLLRPSPRDESGELANEKHLLTAAVLSFLGLNALFLVANLTDVFYLWLNLALPAGVTYSQFARHGSYRLIVAVVLSAVVITAFLRHGSRQASDRRVRLLAYAFAGQNLVVLAGAARRLHLYVEAYGLTRFRLAAALWMVLVVTGYLLIFVKIRWERPFSFLLRTNTVSTVILLSVVSLANLDGFIAERNIARHRAGVGVALDVGYLGSLSAGALPALAALVEDADPEVARRAANILAARVAKERTTLGSWQSWTWRRARAVRLAERTVVTEH